MTRVLIVIDGGNIDYILTTDPHVRVSVIDRDDQSLDPVRVLDPWPHEIELVSELYMEVVIAQAQVEEVLNEISLNEISA
jgi:hypothetical protein